MGARRFFSKEDQASLLESIVQAEKLTSGEIRVHLETHCPGDQIERAIRVFELLGMHDTALHNGVLIYLAVEDKKLAIVGDAGINEMVPQGFWDEVSALMILHFKEGNYAKGLQEGILLAGKQLATHFPRKDDDKNELSDEISFEV